MRRKRGVEIQWKRLLLKALEDGVKKAIELIALAIILGATLKVMLVAVPAVTIGSIIAKLAKLKLIE